MSLWVFSFAADLIDFNIGIPRPVWLPFFTPLGVSLAAWLGHYPVYAFGIGASRSARIPEPT